MSDELREQTFHEPGVGADPSGRNVTPAPGKHNSGNSLEGRIEADKTWPGESQEVLGKPRAVEDLLDADDFAVIRDEAEHG